MELNFDEQEMLKYFLLRCIPDFYDEKYAMSFLKFAFKEEDFEKIMLYLTKLKEERKAIFLNLKTEVSNRTIMVSEFDQIYDFIQELQKEAETPRDEDIYIFIPDYHKFFSLLHKMMMAFGTKSRYYEFNAADLLHSVWLRMGPKDIEDVFSFLRKQIAFIKNDDKLSFEDTFIGKMGELEVSCENAANDNFFETNRHLAIRLNVSSLYSWYSLPVIHYGFAMEDEPTCYIYGLQSLDKYHCDQRVGEYIKPYKRKLRNKYVSADFILALKIAIDFLRKKGFTRIKVPLSQVYNYAYHQNLGALTKKRMDAYSPEMVERIENMEVSEYIIEKYERDKEQYNRFFHKEDLISENKTERLLQIFSCVALFYGDIEQISDPFIEDDILIYRVKQKEVDKTL